LTESAQLSQYQPDPNLREPQSQQSLQYYLRELQSKPYVYGVLVGHRVIQKFPPCTLGSQGWFTLWPFSFY